MTTDSSQASVAKNALTDLFALAERLLGSHRAVPIWLVMGIGLGRLTFTQDYVWLIAAVMVTTILACWLFMRARNRGVRQGVNVLMLIIFFGGIGYVIANSRLF